MWIAFVFTTSSLTKHHARGITTLLTKKSNNKDAVNQRASRNKTRISSLQSYNKPYRISRTVEGIFDIICDGINPSVGMLNFSLNDLPDSTDFTKLFDQYTFESVELTWYPEYTELVDSGLASNAVNVCLNTCVDPVGNTIALYTDVLQYQSCMSTGITKQHTRRLVPTYLVDGVIPQRAYISTGTPGANFYGVGYGVPPTGVAMTLRSRAKYNLLLRLAK